ncbi:hypothetical protein VVT58_22300 (plasmid) [Sphingobium sp. SJ10-10]|uniref:hypothetical protein n=1 Tax=unclassified Sphingobium TaxID=2611147 RepID=UPI0007705B4E|nr:MULTISPECIES: hypothetical protein [unclassified Sphingobium]AMK26538.1 hypothetical protein K426_28205 [Sphingobium sp. TKS]MEC6699563.1 hypothetical protein [Sphingobium sp. SJ10-10]
MMPAKVFFMKSDAHIRKRRASGASLMSVVSLAPASLFVLTFAPSRRLARLLFSVEKRGKAAFISAARIDYIWRKKPFGAVGHV